MSILKVDSVLLEFNGRKILQDVWLSCKQGEIIGLLGRNGCGKTSLLNIIFGSLKAQYSYIAIDDKPLKHGFDAQRITYLPQHNFLPKGIRIDRLAKVLVGEKYWKQFSAFEIYQKYQHKKVTELSGGELRQLETLMVVYSNSDFILLDEPFTHVSPVQADGFKTMIRDIAKIKGVIITDHQYKNILDVSDKIILIENGTSRHIKNNEELIAYNYLRSI